MNQYGFESKDWESAKLEALEALRSVARRRGFIAYSELTSVITAVELQAHDSRLFNLLGEISAEEDAAGRGMLSALVVRKRGDMQPGPGFFDLARKLGRDARDELTCWANEFKKVHAYWVKDSGPS